MDDDPRPEFSLLRVLLLLLVMLAILYLILPLGVRSHPRVAPTKRAQLEVNDLVQAVRQYQVTYGCLPLPTNLSPNSQGDFTLGTQGTKTRLVVTNGAHLDANNTELVAILRDQTHFGSGLATANRDHALNPKQHRLLSPRLVSDTHSPGVGMDGVYRDPWGNPYIVTLDLNGDGRCRDAFYRLVSVSGLDAGTNGLFGLTRSSSTDSPDTFEAQVPVMVWSFGPDGKADPSRKADEGVNKDNVLSWQD